MISTHSDKAREEYSSPAVKEELKAFHQARIKEIIGGNAPIMFPAGGKIVLHMIPVPAYYNERFSDVIASLASGGHVPIPHFDIGHRGVTKTDFDGFANSNKEAYVKMFRSGAIENVAVLSPNDTGGGCYFFGPFLQISL